MARDLSLLRSLSRGECPPTLRLYGWDPPALTVGYFQRIEDELNVAECAGDGVEVIRRITGGGAVFHHHEITYSVVVPLDGPIGRTSITDSYALLCAPLVRALALYGVEASFRPVNDVLAGVRKLSGSAQTRRGGVLLQHGTLLLDVDPGRMFRYLKISEEKKRAIDRSPADRVTSLRELLGDRALSADFRDGFNRAFAGAFEEELGIRLEPGETTAAEDRDREEIGRELFGREDWNARRINRWNGGAIG